MIPLAGGIVGGAFDAASTSGIGKIARAMFIGTSAPDAPSRNVRKCQRYARRASSRPMTTN